MKNNVNKYIIKIFIIILICTAFWKIQFLRGISKLVFISFVISYALKPLHNKLIDRGFNKKISSLIILLCFLGSVIIFFIVLIPSIVRESSNANTVFEEIQKYIIDLYGKFEIVSSNKIIDNFVKSGYVKINTILVNLLENLLNALMVIGENALDYIIIPIIVYYFLADKDNIKNRILIMLPCKKRKEIQRVIEDIDKILGRYIISQFFLCAIIGVLTFIILKFLGVQFPVMLSILHGTLNIIPYFGPVFGMVPIIIVALLSSTKTAIYTAFWIFLLQQLEGSVISPKIIGETVSMHPLIVILLLIIGGKIAGFIGMILAVPAAVILKIIYEDINYYMF